MSIKVMSEVWGSSTTKGGSRLVLLALADFSNDEGYCHPSVARLAVKSALTERNVQLILRDLEARAELVTLRGAGRGNVNAYWVLPRATVVRLTLQGKTAKNFHPLRVLEEKVKTTTETVKSHAEKAKSEAQMVKPVSPRTVMNHQQPSRTTNGREVEIRDEQKLDTSPIPRTPLSHRQPSSADRAKLGAANGSAKSSAPRATRAVTASQAWEGGIASNAPPDWLEAEPWARWLRDLDERGVSATAGRLEEQLKRLRELSADGEAQAEIVARAIAGGWVNFYPPRASNNSLKPPDPKPDDRYGRYR